MKWFLNKLKGTIIFLITLMFVSISLLIYLLYDEINDVYNLWTIDKVSESEYTVEEFNTFYNKLKSLDVETNSELNSIKPELFYHLENVSGLDERKLLNEYINKLNFLKDVYSSYIYVYEFDIYNYLNEENKNFSNEDVMSIDNKSYLKTFLTDLIVEGNHKIVKEDYLEIYLIEIDYNKLISEFETYLDKGYLEELKNLKNNSKQINLRNRFLYN